MRRKYLFNSSERSREIIKSKGKHNAHNVASFILKRAMREDKIIYNKEGRVKYLQEWADHLTEISDTDEKHKPELICDTVADHLIFASSLHIIYEDNNTEVENEFRRDVCNALVLILESSIEEYLIIT